nr:aminotransferase [Actinomycetota bacterium]NIS34315.1 aminotransferase [Actinomycetota bacterium]NIU69097.1 aminotransferase [Actinomycetota bacterium]NIW30958.1 aminotransferase [Actinomycetota bacterium]NIX23330.1 aminotransferase [Actinomycetota bacterium]
MTAVEHSAVLEAARHAARTGDATLTELDVGPDGRLDMDALAAVCDR